MSKSFSAAIGADDAKVAQLQAFVENLFRPEDTILEKVRSRTESEGLPLIQVGKMDGRILEMFARLVGAEKIVEIGVLAGYSGICLARGMKPGGKLYALEVSEKNAAVAKASFDDAGFSDQVDVRVGEASDTLKALSSEGPFDLVFIDADKVGYPGYLEWAAENLRVGGVVLGDNTLAFGKLADENVDPESQNSVNAIRKFNQMLAEDPKFFSGMIPTGEGLTFGIKVS